MPPVFQDREELASSASLAESVRAALEEASSLIVICSPAAAQSRWVNEEIRAFTALGRRARIQCLIADGEPNASRLPGRDPARECLPPALFESGGEEPLASDIRPGQDGRTIARLKLIAGVLAIPFDELRRREQARRQRRLLAFAAAAGIGFLVMTALTVFAFLSRRDAIAQRDLAREKTVTAERTAEFVQSLFEVSDPSEARGAKITALEVLDKGAARIRTSLDDEPNVKAQLMTTLSGVYGGLGSYGRAEGMIREAMRLPATDPGVRARRLMAVAAAAYRRGDYPAAVRGYRAALPFARADAAAGPELEPAILAATGDALALAGDISGGPGILLRALSLDRKRAGPASVPVARDLEALGAYEVAREDYARARGYYERALAIRIARQGRTHPLVSEDLNELSYVAYFSGDITASERFLRQALDIDRLVLGGGHPDTAVSMNNLARVMLERRNFAAARPLLARAAEITVRNRGGLSEHLALHYANLGIAERGLGHAAAATAALDRALVVAEAIGHRNRGPILTELADLACAGGRPAAGLALLQRAEAPTRADYADEPWRDAWLRNTRGACLVAAGRRAEGRALLAGSMKALRARWQPGSLYRVDAERRLVMAGGRPA